MRMINAVLANPQLLGMIMGMMNTPANAGSAPVNAPANAGGSNSTGDSMNNTGIMDPNTLVAALTPQINAAADRAAEGAVNTMFSDENLAKLSAEISRVNKENRPFYKDPLVLGIAGAVAAAGVGYVIYKSHQNSKAALALGAANASAINALGIQPLDGGGVRLLNVK